MSPNIFFSVVGGLLHPSASFVTSPAWEMTKVNGIYDTIIWSHKITIKSKWYTLKIQTHFSRVKTRANISPSKMKWRYYEGYTDSYHKGSLSYYSRQSLLSLSTLWSQTDNNNTIGRVSLSDLCHDPDYKKVCFYSTYICYVPNYLHNKSSFYWWNTNIFVAVVIVSRLQRSTIFHPHAYLEVLS